MPPMNTSPSCAPRRARDDARTSVGACVLATAMLALLSALPGASMARERIDQLHEKDATREILRGVDAVPRRVCRTGARWIRLEFERIALRGKDRIVLQSSGGDRFAFEGGHWNDRAFGTRAMRGDCVRIRTSFESGDSGYRLAAVAYGTRPLAESGIVVAAAGDLCDSTPEDCKATSDLVAGMDPAAVIAIGDLAYGKGTPEEFQTRYHPAWGRFKDRTRPVPGNHEYGTPGASGYFDYFADTLQGAAADPARGYYSWSAGDWHIVALNTREGETIAADDPQVAWLKADLAANTKPCTLAYLHHPLISVGHYAPRAGERYAYPEMKTLYEVLHGAGVDLVLVGHDHNYQRFVKMDPELQPSGTGFVQVLVGTGGRNLYPIKAHLRDSPLLAPAVDGKGKAVDDTRFGVLELTLMSGGYRGRFLPAKPGIATIPDGGTTPDRFDGICNKGAAPADPRVGRW
jgi:hypothetical protein